MHDAKDGVWRKAVGTNDNDRESKTKIEGQTNGQNMSKEGMGVRENYELKSEDESGMTTDKSDLKIILASGEESRTGLDCASRFFAVHASLFDLKGPWHAWHCLGKSLSSGQK
jgi:hypothetical protein